LSLASADDRDTKLQQQIVGTWARGNTEELRICTNGNFHSKVSRVFPNATKTWNWEGTWQIRNGFCFMTTTNAAAIGSTNSPSVGGIDQTKITQLDSKLLILEINNQSITFNRK
jgi:hypothetical protein